MSAPPLLNAAGRRRSLVTLPGYLAGRPPRNKGLRYPPDPPTVEEIVAVMRQAGDGVHGARMRALVVLLWRAGLRINEALALTEHDLEPGTGSVLVRHGKGGRRREVGMDPWGWEHLRPWLELRMALPVGPLLCVVEGRTRGRPWASDAARAQLRRVASKARLRRRFAPHQLRHAHAIELAHEGVPLNVIQRQLGHTNLGVTSTYARRHGDGSRRLQSSIASAQRRSRIRRKAALTGCVTAPRRVGWPGASQPPAPTDPGVTVSRHRALLISPRSTCGLGASG
jgi:integrase